MKGSKLEEEEKMDKMKVYTEWAKRMLKAGDEVTLTHRNRNAYDKEQTKVRKTYTVKKLHPYFVHVTYIAQETEVIINTCFNYWDMKRMNPVVRKKGWKEGKKKINKEIHDPIKAGNALRALLSK